MSIASAQIKVRSIEPRSAVRFDFPLLCRARLSSPSTPTLFFFFFLLFSSLSRSRALYGFCRFVPFVSRTNRTCRMNRLGEPKRALRYLRRAAVLGRQSRGNEHLEVTHLNACAVLSELGRWVCTRYSRLRDVRTDILSKKPGPCPAFSFAV